MAYCRWSSLDYGCDIYLYADVNGGYTCHVASKKRVAAEPCPPLPTHKELEAMSVEEFRAILQAQRDWAEEADLIPIGMEYDGKSFYSYDRDEMVEILKKLKRVGYRMPEWLIDEIANEPDEAK